MAYLGNDLQVAFPTYRNIDDISSSFNGVLTSFPLTVSGVAPIPAPINSQQCLISVNGVVQRPDDSGTEGFRLSGGNIIFASAPAGGVDFFGVILAGADYVNAGANFPSGTAAVPSITFDSDLDTGVYNPAANQLGITTGGTARLIIDASGQIRANSLGSASAPVITFNSDPNTGIYSLGADQLAISTNGTGRLFVDANGSISTSSTAWQGGVAYQSNGLQVGGSSYAKAVLQTAGSSRAEWFFDSADNYLQAKSGGFYIANTTANPIAFYTNGSERLRITSDGKLGVGTSTPGSFNSFANQLVVGTGSGDNGITIYGGSAGSSNISFADGTVGAQSYAGTLQYNHSDDSLSVWVNYAGSTGPRMFINSSGNIGIGTTSPSNLLHLSAAGTSYLQIQNTTASNNFYVGNSGGSGIFELTGANQFKFISNSSDRVVIDSSGKLLVGTSSGPSAGQGQFSLAVVQGYFGDNNGAGDFSIQRGESAAAMSNGDDIGYIKFNDNTGKTFASISALVDGSVGGVNGNPGRIVFSTEELGSDDGPTERMRITNAGRVGIGTQTPGAPLSFADTNEEKIQFNGNSTNFFRISKFSGELRFTAGETSPGAFTFSSGGSEKARLDGSGRLLVGTSSARDNFYGGSNSAKLLVEGTDFQTSTIAAIDNSNSYGAYLVLGRSRGTAIGSNTIVQSGDAVGIIDFMGNDGVNFRQAARIGVEIDGTPGVADMPGRLVFSTTADGASSPTERMRITKDGAQFAYSTADGITVSVSAAAASSGAIFEGQHSATAVGTGTGCFVVRYNGNVQNTNNSYGAISDIKLKENIVDASSQWDDLKDLRVVNYNFKEGQTHTQIGLIAQEVELVSPGLVSESPDRDEEGNDLGTVTKSVNYSVLYMKAVKALQEAMERIETLEASNADLVARVTALEGN